MEVIYTCGLAWLEMTFVIAAFLLLHALRKIIGSSGFYISMGLLLVFTQLVSASELKVITGLPPGFDFYIGSTVLFLPYLTALMIIYITEGTLATQRLIIGAMATLGIFIYISHITAVQCSWPGHSISQGPTADSVRYLLKQSQHTMAGSILAQSLDLFLIPIFFQRLRNLRCRLFIAVLGALMLTQLVDTFVYASACFWGTPRWWLYIESSYIVKSLATIWLSLIASFYISRIDKEIPGEGRGTLDIIFAFFGGYGKAEELRRNLMEWEGRYRLVVENASEMILLLDNKGKILDANFAAVRMMRFRSRKKLLGKFLPGMLYDTSDKPIDWQSYRESFKIEDTSEGPHIQRLDCVFKKAPSVRIDLNIALSSIEVETVPMMIVLGRDVTEENRLAREKEELSLRLAHTQRLESIGQLAGGIAHDFNNYIHAIQGHLDVLSYMYDIPEKGVIRHLDKINDITEKTAKLTQQLLGFARKGKYMRKNIELNELVRQSAELFMPKSQEDMNVEIGVADVEMWVKGDPLQLQQVILNLLINARDAIEDNKGGFKYIALKTGFASELELKLTPPLSDKDFEGVYYYISVEDSGPGIPESDRSRIFEPFFTTKPFGKGTGMGLAMVYGTITNHNGWVQLETETGRGASFYIFLPMA